MFFYSVECQGSLFLNCTDVSISHALNLIPTGMSEKEQQMMKKLKHLVDKQRDEIQAKDHELTCRNDDIEAVRN